jgi:hypothetical protein
VTDSTQLPLPSLDLQGCSCNAAPYSGILDLTPRLSSVTVSLLLLIIQATETIHVVAMWIINWCKFAAFVRHHLSFLLSLFLLRFGPVVVDGENSGIIDLFRAFS